MRRRQHGDARMSKFARCSRTGCVTRLVLQP
jgi:hypothetical protein